MDKQQVPAEPYLRLLLLFVEVGFGDIALRQLLDALDLISSGHISRKLPNVEIEIVVCVDSIQFLIRTLKT